MFWIPAAAGGVVTNVSPYASVGDTASGLYLRRYSGSFVANLTMFDAEGTLVGPSGINFGPGYGDSYTVLGLGYIHAPTGGTFAASVAAVDDRLMMWVGRIARRGYSMSNYFAAGSTNPSPYDGRSGSASLRPGYTPIRVAFAEVEGTEAAAWNITLPPGASFIHATAGLGF